MKTLPLSLLLLATLVTLSGCATSRQSSSSTTTERPTWWESILGVAETSAYSAARQNSKDQSH